MPFGRKSIFIETDIPRIECKKCKIIRQANVNFADPFKRYTKQFERYVLDLLKFMTMKDVSVKRLLIF
ncbi:MAG: transposase family protein [Pseudomonadota bacterium]